jgi:hypothetical protein
VSVPLESLATCFQGLLPAQLFTCSQDGIPNAAYLSHVDYVDASHVALSFQFFNKSRRNIAENPNALVSVIDPDTGQGWQLRLRYERSETAGPLFDRMALRIEAIASYCGLKGIFKLRAADVYQVIAIDAAVEEQGIRQHSESPRAAEPLIEKDADLIEINPLVLTKEGRIIAADSKVTIDDNAKFRHPELVAEEDVSQKNYKERIASSFDLNYIYIGGNIGCLVNGAGLAMSTMDIIKLYGGNPANFLDVGGSAEDEQMVEAIKLLNNDPEVESIFINIFGGILRCDNLAQSIITAAS